MVEMVEEEVIRGRSKIAGNSVSLAVSGAAGMIFTLVQLSILSRTLDGELFGAYVALRGLSLFLATIILIGLPQVIIRFLPSFQNRGEVSRALRLFIYSSVVVLCFGFLIFLSIDRLKGLLSDAQAAFLTDEVLFWMAVSSVAIALKLILYGGFSGLREMRLQMIFEICYLAALTGLIFIYKSSLSITVLFRMISILNGAVYLAGAPVLIRYISRLIGKVSRRETPGVVQPAFLSYTGYSLLLSFVALAFTDFDRFVMSSVLPFSAISIFHVASRISGLIKRFLGFPVVALQPEVTRIYEEGRWDQLPAKIALFTKITVIASFFFAVLAAISGEEVIHILSGSKYSQAYPVMLVLLVSIPIAAFIAPVLSAMRGLNHIKWAALCDFLWMAVYFGSFYFFATRWGIMGMAMAQVLASMAQMSAAVALSKREGFYGGLGHGTCRAVIAFLLIAPPWILLLRNLGLYAVLISIAVSPLVLRTVLVRLRVFDHLEVETLSKMVSRKTLQRLLLWLIGPGV
ncbi:MAG: oligosaccharide flippase family protein [Candidatus Krumholzibacteriota bacterium]|nr:oligosaccharide flippase family protein [Candidatus Krumholzibacteriota bacterium]